MKNPILTSLASLTLLLSLTQCSDKPANATGSGPDSGGAGAPVNDPSGFYTLRSDPSITVPPSKNVLIGNGKLLEVRYDGSKGDNLSYDLFYTDQNGSVHPMTGGFFKKTAEGVFVAEITVFNSNANQRAGFMELTTVTNSGLDSSGTITGKNTSLGMYPVTFEVAP